MTRSITAEELESNTLLLCNMPAKGYLFLIYQGRHILTNHAYDDTERAFPWTFLEVEFPDSIRVQPGEISYYVLQGDGPIHNCEGPCKTREDQIALSVEYLTARLSTIDSEIERLKAEIDKALSDKEKIYHILGECSAGTLSGLKNRASCLEL